MAKKKPQFINATKARIARDFKNFGTIPKEVIELFTNRKIKADECMKACKEILAREPRNAAIKLYIGIILFEAKQHAEALSYFVDITENVPMIYPAWQYRGMCESQLRNFADSRNSYLQLSILQPKDAYIMCFVALTFFMEDNPETAFYFLEEMLKNDRVEKPDVLVWFRAFLEEHMGNKEDALMHYIESQMMGGSKDEDSRLVSLKIHELASEKRDEDVI